MAFKIYKVRPLFTGVITTAITYKGELTTSGGVIIDTRKMEGNMNPYQTVVSVGPAASARGINEGDIVKINFKRYMKTQHAPGALDEAQNKQMDNMSWFTEIPMIIINDVEHLFIQDSDIEYVVEDYNREEVELSGGLLQ
jgi:hypothetical protein